MMSVAHVLLLGCCAPDAMSMFRGPSSVVVCAFACTCDANARIFRPFGAEMAENETI